MSDSANGQARTVAGRIRAVAASGARRLNGSPYLVKWLILGSLIGVVAGLGAVVFLEALIAATHLFLGVVAGYQVPTAAGEGNLPGSSSFPRPWLIPLVVGLGGLISAVLVQSLAPEAEGHGTDEAIDTVHKNPRGIRARAVVVKMLASAITIGSGGSGGREGPIAQISAGFGSLLARSLDLSPEDSRIAVAVGIGSGIGSIFRAPLGGALLSAGIVYKDDMEVEALIPSIIASVIGYTVFASFIGFGPMFGYVGQGYRFTDPVQLGYFAIIGVVAGLMGLAYSKGFWGLFAWFHERLRVSRYFLPAIGGLLTGLIALAVPQVLGTGYGYVQQVMGAQVMSFPLWLILLLPFARIVATGFSIGSGGSGGIFGPGMVIGAFTGAAIWRLLAPVAPSVPADPAVFVIVAMMACFGSIARAPLAVMLMVAEMTGNLVLLAPAMIAVGIATLIVRASGQTIYRSQLGSRRDSPAHRLQAGMPLLASVKVTEVMRRPRLVLSADLGVARAAIRLRDAGVPGAPIVDESGIFLGTVNAPAAADPAGDGPDGEDSTPVGSLADPTAPRIGDGASLEQAVEALTAGTANWVTVVDPTRRVVGIVSVSDLVRGYRSALRTSLSRSSAVSPGTVAIDQVVVAGSALDGVRLRDAGLPPGTVIVTLERGGQPLLPIGETVLRGDDHLGVLTAAEHAGRVRRLLGEPA